MEDPVRQLWTQARFKTKFTPPTILYAFDKNNERFIVISDHGSIYRLINSRGQVFMVANFRCVKSQNNQSYICNNPMHIVSCTKYSLDEDKYANDTILPVVFGTK